MAHVTDVPLTAAGQPDLDRIASTKAELDPPALDESERTSLCEVLDRVLHKGVVVRGDLVISVANIELLYLGLELILCSVERARSAGVRLPRDMTAPPLLPTLPSPPKSLA
jgi:hypothetical protein